MSNETPRNYNSLIALAEDAADGLQTHGVALGILQNTEARVRADIAALVGAEDQVGLKRTAKTGAITTLQTKDSNAKAFIALFIQGETPRIGKDWGPLWDEAGFSNGSISNPTTQEDRFILVGKLAAFLTNHPTYEVTDPARPELDVTAAVATACYTAISTARGGVNNATQASGSAMSVRDAMLDKLRTRITGLRNELTQLPLPDDSPLWYAFGFNRPSDPLTPGTPEGLLLHAGAPGTGTLIVDWAAARRATGYRVKVQVAGEPQPRVLGLFPDDQAVVPGLPLTKLLTVTILAHNDAGDSPESAPATITLS